MQWLLAALLWLLMVGGLALYLGLRQQPLVPAARALEAAQQRVELELQSTALLGGASDPFALDPVAAQPALRLSLGGVSGAETLVVERLAPDAPARFALPGLIAGRNEILVETAAAAAPAALRLRLLVDGDERAQRVLWLEPGQPTVSVLPLRLDAPEAGHGH